MSDVDDALAATAVGLNEEAKAKRRKRGGPTLSEALADSRAHLGGRDGDGQELAEGERWQEGDLLPGYRYDDDGYVVDEDGERTGARRKPLTEALDNLGAAVDAATERDGTDLSEGAHVAAVDRMETLASEAVLEDRTLVFDVRDFLLDQIKSRPKPWSATSTGEQRDVAAACEHAGEQLVRKIVERIAANGAEPVRVLLTKIAIGDDVVITGKVKAFSDEEAERDVGLLHKARGKHVMLTVASVDDYKQEARDADVDAEEPGFAFEAGSDTHDDDD